MRIRLIAGVALLLVAFWLRTAALDSLPPGLSRDESANVLDAFHLSRTGVLPLYEDPEIGRPEPLFRIIQAAGISLFGAEIWAVRMVSVLVGVLSVAAAAWAAREVLHDFAPSHRRTAGLAAAAALAVALGHVTLSRSLYRGIPQPLFMLLFVGLLLRGLRTGRRRDLILSGVSLAAALYTYTAALVLPLGLLVAAGSLLLFRRAAWRAWLPSLGWAVGAFMVLVIPIGLVFVQRPEAVIARAADVSGADLAYTPARRLEIMLSVFVARGDDNPQYNSAGAPLLPPVFNLLFAAGLVVLAARIRRVESALVLSLLVLATTPALLSNEISHGLRICGEYAVFPLIVGSGVAGLLALLSRWLPRVSRRALTAGGVLALLLITGADALAAHQSYTAYWQSPLTWPVFGRDLPIGEWFFRTDRRDFARWLAVQEPPLLLPLVDLNDPPVRAWLLDVYPEVTTADSLTRLPAGTRVVVPWVLGMDDIRRSNRQAALLRDGTITLLPPFSAETHAALLAGIDAAPMVTRQGVLDLMARVSVLPDEMAVTFEPRVDVSAAPTFGGELQLVGWRGPDALSGSAAQEVTYVLEWEALRPLGHNYSAFLQLWTQEATAVAGHERGIWRWLLPTSVWPVGMTVPDAHPLQIPADLAPGAYRLVTGVYVYPDSRLPVFLPDGEPAGDVATVGWVKVPQRDEPPARPASLDVTLGDVLALRDARAVLEDAGRVRLTLQWTALVERPDVDATIFVHVVDENGAIVAQQDARPWGGQYPTFIWGAGERVQTEHLLPIGDAAPETLHVFVGMYTYPDLARLPLVQDGRPADDNRADLGTLADLLAPQQESRSPQPEGDQVGGSP